MKTKLLGSFIACLVTSTYSLAQTPPKPAATTPSAAAEPAIPPDAEHATKALVDSPRHGEWVEIVLSVASDAVKDPGKDGAAKKPPTLKTWISYPERKDAAPVVIVIHEIFGMTDWVRGVADQLAADGFIAVAPDLLSGKGPNGGATDSFAGDAARQAIGKLDPAEVTARLNAVRDYAMLLPSAKTRTACIGFCWGGSTTFAYATNQPKLDAAVVYYGTAPTANDVLAKLACPVLGLYGADDARVTSTVEATTKATGELKKPYTPKVYEKAGHGFLRQQTARDGANIAAARQAWEETIAFLRKQLEVAARQER